MNAYLEHANITVFDPDATAALLCELFDWKIRWSGQALHKGYTVHVGSDTHYLALYTHDDVSVLNDTSTYDSVLSLNHLGVVVDDLSLIESRVKALSLRMGERYAYEPGERFYFFIDCHRDKATAESDPADLPRHTGHSGHSGHSGDPETCQTRALEIEVIRYD